MSGFGLRLWLQGFSCGLGFKGRVWGSRAPRFWPQGRIKDPGRRRFGASALGVAGLLRRLRWSRSGCGYTGAGTGISSRTRARTTTALTDEKKCTHQDPNHTVRFR